jgi:hypothetical protein
VTGSGVFTAGEDGSNLTVITYIPVSEAQGLATGIPAIISPINYLPNEYGYLEGTVIAVADTAIDQEGTAMLAVEVKPSDRWTIDHGKEIQIASGTPCTVTLITKEEHPISRFLPGFGS